MLTLPSKHSEGVELRSLIPRPFGYEARVELCVDHLGAPSVSKPLDSSSCLGSLTVYLVAGTISCQPQNPGEFVNHDSETFTWIA